MIPADGGSPPVWLLDVDGVLNAVTRHPDEEIWPAAAWVRHRVATLDGRVWPILTARPVLDFVTTVHEAGRAEIRWHSTWQDSAVRRLAPALGLPRWPVAAAPEFTDLADSGYAFGTAVTQWWKTGAAERVRTEEQRALVWTDDDLWVSRSLPEVEHLVTDPQVCAVSPLTAVGLTPADLARIDQFLTEHA